MDQEEENEVMSLRSRRHKNRLSIDGISSSCCFNINGIRGQHRRRASLDASSASSSACLDSPTSINSSSSPRRSPSFPEIKDKCRNLISRMGGRHRRHYTSAEFSYDPLSYALNFNNDDGPSSDNELRALNFTARLPASPPSAAGPIMRFNDHHNGHLPRSPAAPCCKSSSSAAGNDDLIRRGFEALADSIKDHQEVKEAPTTNTTTTTMEVEQRRINLQATHHDQLNRAAAVAEVRRTLEDVTTSPPVQKREVLVQFC